MARLLPQVAPAVRPALAEEVRRMAETIHRPDLKAQALTTLATDTSR